MNLNKQMNIVKHMRFYNLQNKNLCNSLYSYPHNHSDKKIYMTQNMHYSIHLNMFFYNYHRKKIDNQKHMQKYKNCFLLKL